MKDALLSVPDCVVVKNVWRAPYGHGIMSSQLPELTDITNLSGNGLSMVCFRTANRDTRISLILDGEMPIVEMSTLT